VQRDDRVELRLAVLRELPLQEPARSIELGTPVDDLRPNVRDEAAQPVPILEVVVALERGTMSCAQVLGRHAAGGDVRDAPFAVERMAERRDVHHAGSIDGPDATHACAAQERLLATGHP